MKLCLIIFTKNIVPRGLKKKFRTLFHAWKLVPLENLAGELILPPNIYLQDGMYNMLQNPIIYHIYLNLQPRVQSSHTALIKQILFNLHTFSGFLT